MNKKYLIKELEKEINKLVDCIEKERAKNYWCGRCDEYFDTAPEMKRHLSEIHER